MYQLSLAYWFPSARTNIVKMRTCIHTSFRLFKDSYQDVSEKNFTIFLEDFHGLEVSDLFYSSGAGSPNVTKASFGFIPQFSKFNFYIKNVKLNR